MGEILQSLKASAQQRPNHLSPVQARRNNLLRGIHEQLEAAKAKSEGRTYQQTRIRRIKNKETGETTELSQQCSVRECWWTDQNGKVFLELRYGYRTLEFAKGKTAVEVGAMSDLVPVLEKLRTAAVMGEFDEQLTDMAGRLSAQLQAKRKAAK